MTIGERLKNWRNDKGLTSTEISKTTRISQSSISDYENNKMAIGSQALLALYEHYNIDINWILTGIKNENILDEEQEQLLYYFALCDRETRLDIIKMIKRFALSQQCNNADEGKSSTSKIG